MSLTEIRSRQQFFTNKAYDLAAKVSKSPEFAKQ